MGVFCRGRRSWINTAELIRVVKREKYVVRTVTVVL